MQKTTSCNYPHKDSLQYTTAVVKKIDHASA